MAVVQQGQNLIDIAAMHCGDVSFLFSIAFLNNISPTAEVAPGTDLIMPEDVSVELVAYLSVKSEVVATNNDFKKFEKPSGIGYWAIGDDFIIS